MNSILKTDFYKVTHMLQYRDNITHFTSYLTPRGSRFKSIDKMVVFGIANFVNEYLFKGFNEEFFNVEWPVVRNEVVEVLEKGLGYPQRLVNNTLVKIGALHNLGYLPIEINGLPEGSICPMQVPAIEIRSTDFAFAWVAQSIESLLSCEFWHPTMSATIAHEYAKIAKAAYDKTVCGVDYKTAMCDFSMRGQESYESAVASGAGFLTSFYNCSTVESRYYIKRNYVHGDEVRVNGLTSTEHSVMCSDFSLCGDERETLKRLLTEVYPDVSFSAVSDSYDFWHLVTEILPTLKEEIENHKGFIGIRHDCYTKTAQLLTQKGWQYIKDITIEDKVAQFDNGEITFVSPLKIINDPYKGDMYRFYSDKFGINTMVTPNHRMVRFNKKKQNYQVITADKICYYDGMGLPRNGLLKGEVSELTPLEKLFIAYQADGYCTKSCLNKTEQFDRGYTIKFQFSKKKKIKHLIEICEEGGFEYWVRSEYKSHKLSQKDETEIYVKIFEKPVKRFENWVVLIDKNKDWCRAFIEEMSYWDCRIRKDCPYIYEYINTHIKDAEIIQTIGSLAGYNTHFSLRDDNRREHYKNCCYVTINKDNNIPCYTIHKEKIENYEGNIYCVNVPSGQLIVRDNNQIFISGNSSEPVHALCGVRSINLNEFLCEELKFNSFEDFENLVYEIVNDDLHLDDEEVYFEYKSKNKTYKGVFGITPYIESYDHKGREWIAYETTFLREEKTPEDKGLVEVLYELFGGEKNDKGYIVINPKVKAVYGDSITIPRAKEIYNRLEKKGFAANNVSLGVGSFSMECLEEDGVLKPFTRDSFSIAVKATYGRKRIANGEVGFPIFKDPKGCEGKKSLKGLCRVVKEDGEFKVIQNLTEEKYNAYQTHEMVNYFKDGKPVKYSFEDVRNRLEEAI